MTTTELDPEVWRTRRVEVEDFLYTEAALLDSREFSAWLALFTADGRYWIPAGADERDPTRHVSVVFDDVETLSERVARLEGSLAYAQQPPSRTAHLVTNVQLTGIEPDDGTDGREVLRVTATFLVSEFRRGVLHAHSGRYRYELVTADRGLCIRLKKVELTNNDGMLGNLSLPL